MILVADNIQVMNQVVERAIKEMDPEPICNLAGKCENAGAQMIDINPGPLSKNAEKKMKFLVEAVQETTKVRLLLDTGNPQALEAGIRACRTKPIINGFSLEPRKLDLILPLAVNFQTDIIGFLLSPEGQVPHSSEERLNIASRLMEEANRAGLMLEKLIIDPVIVPLAWKDGTKQLKEVLSTIKLLPELFGFPTRTIVGISNIISGSPSLKKSLLPEEVCLSMLSESGLTMALLNIFHKRTLETARICDSINNNRIFSWAEI